MSPVVISRGVVCVRGECQQRPGLVGVLSSGSGKEALQLSLWQSFASGFGSQKQPRGFLLHGFPGEGQEARTLDRDRQSPGWETAHSLRLSRWLSVFRCKSGELAPESGERCASAQTRTFSRSNRQLLRFICLGFGMFNHAN